MGNRSGKQRPSSADGFEFMLLGTPGWQKASAPVVELSANDAALVAILVLDGPTARDTLAGRLWPKADQARASSSLRQRLKRLRDESGLQLFGGHSILQLFADVAVDLRRLSSLPAERLLHTQELLAGCEYPDNEDLEDWLREQRQGVRRQRAQALAAHAEAHERAGELARALELAEAITTLVPLLEHGWRRLMRLHALRGDRSAAIEAYGRLEALLELEPRARPDAETLALLRQIEQSAVPAPPSRRRLPMSLVRPPQRVGRAAEWLAIERAWAGGRAFLLVGEAGIGKSRLLEDLAQSQPGALLLRARPGDAQTPYSLLAGLLARVQAGQAGQAERVPALAPAVRRELARLLPAWGPAPAAHATQDVLWRAVEQYLAAAVAGGLEVLLVDDLHVADLASLEALRWLCAGESLSALRVGLASRPLHEAESARLVEQWLADSQRPERIAVQALDAAAVQALLDSLALPEFSGPGVAEALFAHAAGHPFYTLETLKDALLQGRDLRAGPLPVPATARTLIERRLQSLPPEARPLLHVATVAGSELTPERAAALLGQGLAAIAGPWSALEQAGVLQGTRFAHDLLHECARELLPPALRGPLHGATAALLQAEGGVAAGRIAGHWEAAGRWAEAGAAWAAAARDARQAGRLVEQAALLENAAGCLRRAGHDDALFEVLHARFEGLQLRHGGAAVLAELPTLQALARDDEQRLRCRLVEAAALIELERGDDAAAAASAAVAAASRRPDRIDALCLQSMAWSQVGRFDDAVAAGRQAESLAREAQAARLDREGATAPLASTSTSDGAATRAALALRAARSLAYALQAGGRVGEAIGVQRDAARRADELGDQSEAASSLGNLAAMLQLAGDNVASHAAAVETVARYRGMGIATDSALGCAHLMVLGATAAYLGRFGEAMAALREAVSLAGAAAATSVRAKSRLLLAGLWITLGQAAEAQPLLDELPAGSMPAMRMQAALLRARLAWLDGGDGAEHLQELGAIQARLPDPPLLLSAWLEWSHQGEAGEVLDRLATVRQAFEHQGCDGAARSYRLRELARLLELAGREAEALGLARELRPWADDGMGSKTYAPEAWLLIARGFERGGDAAAAAEARARGRRWLEQRALPNLPAAWVAGFTGRNPVNRQLLGAGGLGG